MPVVGRAEIVVTAITAGFKQQIQQAFRDARPEAAKEGERYGKAFGKKFRVQIKDDVQKAFRENRDWVKQEGTRQGQLFGAEFAKSFGTEFQARMPGLLQGALGDPDNIGQNYGKRFADAAKRGAQQGGTISPEDVIAPGAAPEREAGPARPPAAVEEALSGRARIARAKETFEELEALAREHDATLFRIQQLAQQDEINLERAKLTVLATDADEQEAADNDRIREHLAKVLYAALTEEDVAQHLADYSAARQAEAQAALDATVAKMKAAEEEMRAAQVQRSPAAARKELNEAQRRYEEIRDAYDRAQLEEKRAGREAVERGKELALALRAIEDRELELDEARRKKKSTKAAQQALADARVQEEAARREAEAAIEWSDLASARVRQDAEETADALRRLQAAEQPTGARLNFLTIAAAEKAHEQLKQLRREAEDDEDAANARKMAAYQELTEAEYELARRRDDLIAASGKRRLQAEREYANQIITVREAAARAEEAAAAADVTRVRHERIVVDVDRSAMRIDLFKEGRNAGLSFTRGMTPEFKRAAEAAHAAWSKVYRLGMAIGPAVSVAIGAVASLGSGLVSLASAAAQASASLVVLPGLIGALGQAAVTAMIAFKGVGEAIGAGFKSAEAAASATGGATKAQARALADARKALARAYEDSARRMRDANRDVGDAEQDLAEAQNRARIAQNSLDGARRRAMETLEDLKFSLEGAVLSEEEAVLRLQRATQALAEVRANPAATAQELAEASLNYREAELALRMAQDALEDIQEEEAAASAAGVEGSAEVVAAKNDIIEANNNVSDMEERLLRAEEDRTDASIDNARAIADAQERVAEALEDQGTAAGGAQAAADAYEAALAKLSPPARDFVEYIVSLKDRVGELREAAGAELFGPLKEGVQDVVDNFFPAFEEALRITGGAIGDFATSITDVIASSQFVARFTQIAEDNTDTIRRFGEIIASVIDGISGVLVAAGPLIDRFTSFLSDKAKDFQDFATSGEGIEQMARYFERAGDTAGKFGTIIGNLISAFGGLMSAADESGQTMLDRLIRISQNFEELVTSAEGHTEFEDYFNRAGENASDVLGLIWDLIKALGSLGDEAGVGEAARTLRREWVPVVQDILEVLSGAGGALADVVVEVTKIARAFADTESIQTFLDILSKVAGLVREFVESNIGQYLLNTMGPIAAAASAIGLVVATVGKIGEILGGAFLAIEGFVKGIGTLWSTISSIIAQVWTAITILIVNMKTAWTQAILNTQATTAWGIAMGGVSAAASTLGAALWRLATTPIGLFLTALTTGIALFTTWSTAQKNAEERTKAFTQTLNEQTGAITSNTIEEFIGGLSEELPKKLEDAGLSIEQFVTALMGSEQDFDTFIQQADDAGLNLDALGGTMSVSLSYAYKDFHKYVGDAQEDLRIQNAVQAAANTVVEESAVALADQKIAAMGVKEQNEFITEGMKKLNEQYEKALQNYTNLNDKAITSQRTAIRIAEANDNLAGSFDEVLKGLEAQIDENGKVIKAKEELIKIDEAGMQQIDQSVQSGRDLQTQIIDYLSLLDEEMQANIERGDSVEVATQKYNDQKDAFINSAGAAGISTEAVKNYIAQIELTPSEKKTRFIAVMEEAAVTKMISEISDMGLQARVIEMVGQLDHDPTLADIMAIKAQIEAEMPGLQFPVTVDAQSLATTQSTLASMLVDPDGGGPLTASVLLEGNKASYKTLRIQLMEFSKQLGVPIAPEVLDPELKLAKKTMDDLLVDPKTKKPRTVEMLSKVDKEKYDAAEKEFNELARQRAALLSPETRQSEINRVQGELDALMAPRKTPLTVDDQNAIKNKQNELNALKNPIVTPLTVAVSVQKPPITAEMRAAINAASPQQQQAMIMTWRQMGYNAAEGGPIIGQGGPKADKVGPFMLSSGEFVLSAKAVKQLGGLSAVTSFHKALKKGWQPPQMQLGGVVMPRSGGMLATLAEGGRAELVTPLDAQGLSKGDRAILDELKRIREGGVNVAIGTILAPQPQAAAKEIVMAIRAETYRMGQYR